MVIFQSHIIASSALKMEISLVARILACLACQDLKGRTKCVVMHSARAWASLARMLS
jgi:hypothetical protein